jgi:hypothetical protein
MKTTTRYFLLLVILLSKSLLSASKVCADMGGGGVALPPRIGLRGNITLVGAGVGVGAVALISWFVIRKIRKNKKIINKKEDIINK